MRVCLVVARARNGVIGNAGALPWRMPSDLKSFKALTMGKPVIMGRKTFESIGKPLPGRTNIVVTRQQDYAPGGVEVAPTLARAVDLAHDFAYAEGVAEIMIIGGGEIYRQSLELADRVYLTEIAMDVDGDTKFPDLDPRIWEETWREHHDAGKGDSADYEMVVLDRKHPPEG